MAAGAYACACVIKQRVHGAGSLGTELQEWQPVKRVEADPFPIGLDPQKAEGKNCCRALQTPLEYHSLV